MRDRAIGNGARRALGNEIEARPSPTPAAYHKLPIAEKRALDLERVRERAVTCPRCDTQVMPADLLAHMEKRCAGPRDPGPGAKWVDWREARAMGVPGKTLSRWANNGLVRFTGGRMDRKYLHRDLAVKIAQRNGFRRR